MDWKRIALRDRVNAEKAAKIAAGQLKKCPYDCGAVIDIFKQSHETGGGVFVCSLCDRRSFMDKKGQLTTEEEYAAACDDACET